MILLSHIRTKHDNDIVCSIAKTRNDIVVHVTYIDVSATKSKIISRSSREEKGCSLPSKALSKYFNDT